MNFKFSKGYEDHMQTFVKPLKSNIKKFFLNPQKLVSKPKINEYTVNQYQKNCMFI